jgi:hypothetical protein
VAILSSGTAADTAHFGPEKMTQWAHYVSQNSLSSDPPATFLDVYLTFSAVPTRFVARRVWRPGWLPPEGHR